MKCSYIIIANINGVEIGIEQKTGKSIVKLDSNSKKTADYSNLGNYETDKTFYVKSSDLRGEYYRVIHIISNPESDVCTLVRRLSNVTILKHGKIVTITPEEFDKYDKFQVNNARISIEEYNEHFGIKPMAEVAETQETEIKTQEEVVESQETEIETHEEVAETQETEIKTQEEVVETYEVEQTKDTNKPEIIENKQNDDTDEAVETEPEQVKAESKTLLTFEVYKELLEKAAIGDVFTLPADLFFEGENPGTIRAFKSKIVDAIYHELGNDIHWIAILRNLEPARTVAFVEWYGKDYVKVKILGNVGWLPSDNIPQLGRLKEIVYDTYLEYMKSSNRLSLKE